MSEKDTEELIKQAEKLLDERRAQIQEKIGSELNPFLESIQAAAKKSREFSIFKEAFLDFRNKYESKQKILESLISPEGIPSMTSRLGEFYALFLYLGTVESVGNAVVDILVMFLVANGIDFHIECQHRTPRIKHATSIRDLEEERIPLATKLNFLRDNGICEVARIMDSQLRNDIAHLNFHVKENRMYIRNKSAAEVLLLSVNDLFAGISYAAGFLHGSAERMGIVAKQEIEEKGSHEQNS